ncbi:MAG: VOC family protein [Alphaproteobacteria bacterium]|nr:VOC family protein [Alphaproteobacteria bacterium]
MPPMNGVIPYLAVEGADAAGKLYAEAFGAKEHRRMAAQDGKRLMHLHLSINGGSLMLSDTFPEFGHPHQPSNCFTMTLVVADGQMWWDRAVKAGLDIVSPYKKEMWGDNYGQLKDRFGVMWAINSPVA